ncbi:DUF917 domain-containing protein [Bifidobacterium miconisargentati]|uniref:DUF917 domain-containing protein n=1 Tax=Bifidobacterium miconisargentati TaxID=2834437 RepID=UPI001BDDA831|nr:DUF917 domain-containing protein [Bifidobacterium miconisargentati]MBW3090115.1 DUF917 domain-containing protein [Bifidobacterium miconisargentati]
MRTIGVDEINDIALGAALLGAGGGGDPYIGRLIALQAVRECGPVTLIEPDELPDDAFIAPCAMMGAPTVMTEKGSGRDDFDRLFDLVEQYSGHKVYATMPMEAGGVNSMLPIAAAARRGIPLVDVDGMGRAFPELQMVTFTIGGASATPLAYSDEKGNAGVMSNVSNKWTEDIARSITNVVGGQLMICLYTMSAQMCRQWGVKGIITKCEQYGKAIRSIKEGLADTTTEQRFLELTDGYRLFSGKVVDVLRETRGAFNFGKVVLEGIGGDKGHKAAVEYQNENLRCEVDGETLATAPDLICLVDHDTYTPVPNEAVKYGKRVLIVGLPCAPQWRTEEGLKLVGPRYFGIDTDYIPVEERSKRKGE